VISLQEIADKIPGSTLRGDNLSGPCPAHDDSNPSFTGAIGDSGAIVLHCFAGCALEDICAALGISQTELFPDNPSSNGGKDVIVATYSYTDADGWPLFEVVRYSPKKFRQRRPDGRGGWIWNLKDVDSRPLFHLPDVLAARSAGELVWVCEGEKDAERLQRELDGGEVATTIPGGAGKWRDEHTETLRDTGVMVVADNDGPGIKHARQVAARLEGVARFVVVVRPADGHKDAADHLNAGLTTDDFPELSDPPPDEPVGDDLDAHLPNPIDFDLDNGQPLEDDDEHTTWWPVNLADLFNGDIEPLQPTMLARTDGQHLLYPGKHHALNGEPESGKSWGALLACYQNIVAGNPTLYIDFEDTAATIVARLLAMGADPKQVVQHFTYLAPSEPVEWRDKITGGGVEFATMLADLRFDLAIIDGVTEAMTLHGLDINSNTDVATFYRILPRRLQAGGSATAQIDHVPKSRDNRGRGGIGGQHKLAGIDVSYQFDVATPFGFGKHGIARVIVEKDRHGQLRQHANGRRMAELHLESDPDTHDLQIEMRAAPGGTTSADGKDFVPTALMEKVSRFVEDCNTNGIRPSQRDIESGVVGKGEYVRLAVAELVRRGHLVKDGRQKSDHTIVTPYRDTTKENTDATD
jgi:5S rRNA maturation endonuclease (ribonuclease M5)